MQTDLLNYPPKHWQRRYIPLAILWSVLVVGSLVWDIYTERQSTLRTATAAALASINKDISFRKWANSHGGVYVPPTAHTPPNPYLNVPDRDVVTTTGKALTLMNPAYVLREMQTDFPDDFGTKSHITSLKLLNPKNAPDAWETKALRSFEQGVKELQEAQQIDGQPYLRLMRPFFIDRGCLKCHEQQGYKLGDIRGGISTAISLKPYLAREQELITNMALSHSMIWLIGLAGLGISYRRDRRQAGEREKTANILRESAHSLSEAQRIAHLGSWNLDIVRNVLTWSDEIYRIFEIDPKKFGATYDAFLNAIHPDDRELVNNAYTESLKSRTPYNISHRLLMKDGRIKYVNEICETSYDKDGTPLRSFGVVHDITERKQMEEKLAQREALFRNYFDLGQIGMAITSLDQRWLRVNDRLCEMLGYTREELTKMTWAELTYPDDLEPDMVQFRKLLSGEIERYSMDKRFVRKNGSIAHTYLAVSCQRKPDGDVDYVIASLQDITERKLAENELREKEERLALATLHNGVGVWDWNLITQEMIWDDSMYSLYCIRREDFIGTEEAWRAALHPDDLGRGDQEVNDAISGKKPFDTEFRVVWPNGEIHHIKAVAKVFRDGQETPLRMLGINMDITELRRTAIALQEKTSLLRNIIDSSADYIFAKDRELHTILCNEIFARTVGKHVGDIIGKTDIENGWDPLLVKGDAAKGLKGYEQDDLDAIAGKTIRSVDQLYIDGELRYVDTVKLPLRDEAGHTLGMFGISRDITASKLRENIQTARLRLTDYAANHTLKELLIATLDEACALTGSSVGFYHFLDADQQTLTLQAWSTRTTREFCKAQGEGAHYNISDAGVWVDCVRERRPVIHNDYAALPNKRGLPPGHAHVEREMVVPIFRNELIVAILGVGNKAAPYKDNDLDSVTQLADLAWDIAVAKRASEEIHRLNAELEQRVEERTASLEAANKDMESFSYSISHDLRAPLRAINGFSKILQDEYVDRLDDEGKRLLNVVGDNAHKMGELIDDILAFSRAGRNEIGRSAINMKNLVAGVWEELKPDMGKRNVQLDIRDIPPTEGDPAMMHQVVFNLLSNAVKFTQHRADARVEVGGYADEHETVYHIKDNGVGFNMQYADKLFGVFQRLHGMDEFEGTGIGLAIVKRIITKHGGRVWAEGKVGEGATIYFALPTKEKDHG